MPQHNIRCGECGRFVNDPADHAPYCSLLNKKDVTVNPILGSGDRIQLNVGNGVVQGQIEGWVDNQDGTTTLTVQHSNPTEVLPYPEDREDALPKGEDDLDHATVTPTDEGMETK